MFRIAVALQRDSPPDHDGRGFSSIAVMSVA
jgi:hypothetical protein